MSDVPPPQAWRPTNDSDARDADAGGDFAARFPRASEIIEQGIADRLHIGAQIYVSRNLQTLADTGIGSAAPGRPMSADHILVWLSAGKPFAAVAIGQLWERGLLELDDRVADHLPAFGNRGKENITLRQLLTHTCGFRWANSASSSPWEAIIERICAAPLEPHWIPGRTAGYHAFTSWYILGELVRLIDPQHRPYDQYVREEIFEPLGMQNSWFSMTPEQVERDADRISLLIATNDSPVRPLQFDRPENSSRCVPGASGRGPMRELGRFYEMLLRRGVSQNDSANSKRILLPQTVEALIARHRTGIFDLTFKHMVDWGLGFVINSAQYGEETVPYGFGPHASPRTFGHAGNQSSIGMADPDNHLVIALVFNGMPGEEAHQKRMRAALRAIYEDLQLIS